MSDQAPATVLVVDDNMAKRYVIARWLRQAGFEVTEALTGAETLRIAGASDDERAPTIAPPDLIVLDIRLPDMSGFEVCRRLKSRVATAHIPVLHVSAHVTASEDRAAGLEGGADGYLTYPTDPRELAATVHALLRIRRTEIALRESEERYRLVARATNDVIWDWNLVTGEVLWNEAASTLFRRPAHEIVPTSQWWYGNIHPADRQRVVSGIRRVIDQAGEQWTDEYRVLRGDGTYATVLDRGHVAHDARGVSVRMIGSMLDLTERKRAEEHQRLVAEATSTLSDALDPRAALHAFARLAVPRVADVCAVFVPDDDTRRMIPLVVVASEGIDGDRVHAALRATPRDVSDPRDVMARCIRSGMGTLCGVTRDEGADVLAALGTESAVVAPIQANGRTFGAVVLGRRQAPVFAAAELTTIQDLVLRVALAVDHARLYDNAVLANRAKSDFLAVMSHELRTPLNAVVGYADLLLLGIPGPLTAESQQYVSRVLACAKHLLQLIEQILSFSRIEAGREEVRTERVELPALARETAAIVEPRAREKGLRFELAIDAPPTAVLETDVDKVREILLNLLSNAVKFTERGTVRLDVRLAPGTAEFEVRDSGIGIPVRHIDHIFDPFWQVEQRKTRTAGGTGLGLSVSRRLAQLLGGELAVVSREGEGSRFTLRLPVGR